MIEVANLNGFCIKSLRTSKACRKQKWKLKMLRIVSAWCHNSNWTGRGQSWPPRLWPQISEKLIRYLVFFCTYSCRTVFRISFELLTWPQKMTFWCPFWRIFVRSPAAVSPADPPPSAQFYCIYRPPKCGRSPTGPWSTVRCGPVKNQFPVMGCVECRGRRVLSRPALSLFLSGQQVPHRSGEFPETGGL
jgi:hypothetical protein